MKKTLKALLALSLVLAVLAGCAPKKDNRTENKAATEETKKAEDSSETIEFTDSAGRKVAIPKNVERIAPVGPPAQQMLLTFAPEKLVGLTGELSPNQTKYIKEEYSKLPVFGAFYGAADINMEAIAAADPQLIIDIGERKETVIQDMDGIQEQLKIPTIFIEATMETMPEAYVQLGKVLGMEEEGEKYSDYCRKNYKEITKGLSKVPEDQRKTFLYTGGENGLNVISKGLFHGEITDMMGKNVAVLENKTSRGTGDPVSEEVILSWKPEIILFQAKSIYDKVKRDPVFSTMDAVKEGKVYETPSAPYSWLGSPPSINRYMGMLWLGKLFYPDVFEYDLKDKTKEYYKLFYDYDLTDDEYTEITAKACLNKKSPALAGLFHIEKSFFAYLIQPIKKKNNVIPIPIPISCQSRTASGIIWAASAY